MARRKLDINSLPSNNLEPTDNDIVPVIQGRVKTRGGGGLATTVRDISNTLFEQSVLPSLKSTFLDFANQALESLLFRGGSVSGPPGRHRAYHSQYRKKQRPNTYNRRKVKRVEEVSEVFEDIFFDDRNDAELVLGRMMERIAEYGQATIGDLYSLCGLSPNYTDENYGWTDLRRCRVQWSTEGYVIDFPEPYYFK